jgi:serine/threonine-protein kinase HipA
MGRKRISRDLFVAMNGRRVGTLTRLGHGELRFSYDEGWLDSSIATPLSLSLPLSPEPYRGPLVASYFENLLPDNVGIRRRMQVVLDVDTSEPFDLLSAAGADCVGALQLYPEPEMPDVRRIDAAVVSDAEIARVLRDYRERPLGMSRDDEDFRISLAGAQEKTAFLWHRGRWQRPRDPTPTTHVFKLPIGNVPGGKDLSDSVENEWLCSKVVEAFGASVANTEIRRFGDQTVLVVERFDRQLSDDGTWIIRLPQEDLCQARGVPPARKYESDGGPGIVDVMDTLAQSLVPHEDRSAFLRTQVVFWLLAAIDGHAKNFSIFLHPGGRFRSTPLYDVLSAYPLLARKDLAAAKIRMAMAVRGKNRHYRWKEIQRRHWLTTAERCRFPAAATTEILDDCASKIDAVIAHVEAQLPRGFPATVSEPIFEGLASMKRWIA